MPPATTTTTDPSTGRVPKISRKVRTCTECKRLKIKCILENGNQVCNRCNRMGLSCIFNKSLQTILDEDLEYKKNLRKDLFRLERVTDDILSKLQLPGCSTCDDLGNPTVHAEINLQRALDSRPAEESNQRLLQYNEAPADRYSAPDNHNAHVQEPSGPFPPRSHISDNPNPQEPISAEHEGTEDDEDTLVTEPMGSLYEVTKLQKFRRRAHCDGGNASAAGENKNDDIIARGILKLEEAEELFVYFMNSLNHYLWVGLDNESSDLESVRRSSQILTLSIMTATSMHMPNKTATYDLCYSEFLCLVSKSLFNYNHTLEDVKGLCIAAFWLSDISWKLSGHAIRIATELELHKAFSKASESKEFHERARMWYMLYVCDHHFSIAYGRPPMIQECQQIRDHEKFLKSPYADTVDFRMLSQVALFSMFSEIHDVLGRDGQSATDMMTLTREYNIKLDQWRLLWQARQRRSLFEITEYSKFIGSFPPKGIVLYYHFAKLQLNILALRNIPPEQPSETQVNVDPDLKEFINLATTAALNIINLLLEDPGMRRALVGVPLYVHTMLTFACLFLFKVATRWKRAVGVWVAMDLRSLCTLIERVVECVRTSAAGERHLIHRIASGLEKMVNRCRLSDPAYHHNQHQHAPENSTQEQPQQMSSRSEDTVPQPQNSYISADPTAPYQATEYQQQAMAPNPQYQFHTWEDFVGDTGLDDMMTGFWSTSTTSPFNMPFDAFQDGLNFG